MPHWLIIVLLATFAIHGVVFFRLLLVRRDVYFAYITLTFLLLVISYSLRLWFGNWHLVGLQAFWVFRFAAWGAALVSITMTIRRYGRRKK